MNSRRLLSIAAAAALLIAGLSVPVLAGKGEGRRGDGPPAHGDFDMGPGGPKHGRGPGGPGGPEGPGGPPDSPQAIHRAMMPFWENEELSADLGLSEEQVKLLTESHAIAEEVIEAHRDTVEAAGKALRDEMQKDAPDAAAVKDLATKFAAERQTIAHAGLEHAVHVKNILTADQEKTLRSNAREFGREQMERLGELRGEIRDILVNGGTLEDVKALLEDEGVPERLQKVVLRRVEQRMAEKAEN